MFFRLKYLCATASVIELFSEHELAATHSCNGIVRTLVMLEASDWHLLPAKVTAVSSNRHRENRLCLIYVNDVFVYSVELLMADAFGGNKVLPPPPPEINRPQVTNFSSTSKYEIGKL
jgi:hypothetical protein